MIHSNIIESLLYRKVYFWVTYFRLVILRKKVFLSDDDDYGLLFQIPITINNNNLSLFLITIQNL